MISVTPSTYGTLKNGRQVAQYTLSNGSMEVDIINFGGIITAIRVPDKTGRVEDVVLGFDSLSQYEENPSFFGCIVGRYGNRIANARFSIDGKEYVLEANNGKNSLHGGTNQPFHKVLWDAEHFEEADRAGVILTHESQALADGFPGNVTVKVTYSLTSDHSIQIDYEATTDEKTILNLTNHSYFNLTGNPENDVLLHQLKLDADAYLPVDEHMIPYGKPESVAGTPFDFRELTAIGARINEQNTQLETAHGYDHNLILRGEGLRSIGWLYEPESGRMMETLTSEPGVQVYTGNWVEGTGKQGSTYQNRAGICLETQHYPNSPNRPEYPSTLLNPGEKYETTTIYRFSVKY